MNYTDSDNNGTTGKAIYVNSELNEELCSEAQAINMANNIIYGLTLVGAFILIVLGIAESSSALFVIVGLASMISSTLVFVCVKGFALIVNDTHACLAEQRIINKILCKDFNSPIVAEHTVKDQENTNLQSDLPVVNNSEKEQPTVVYDDAGKIVCPSCGKEVRYNSFGCMFCHNPLPKPN